MNSYSAIYTDGSKDDDRVASAAVFGQQVYSFRLPSAISIFSVEANAILLYMKFVTSSGESKFMICSDSLSCLLAIESCKTQNPFILEIVEIYKNLVAIVNMVFPHGFLVILVSITMVTQSLTWKQRTHWMIIYL